MSKKKTHYSFDFVEVIAFLIRWKKHLLIVTFSAAILAAIFSAPFFITPLYKSTALFYPGTTNSVSSQLFYSIKEKARDPLKFGDEEVAGEYLQILESPILKSKVMNHFNLMTHYKIDSTSTEKWTTLYRMYDKNIKTRRTEYNSIEVSVYDPVPKYAADIANYILQMVDTVEHEVKGRVAMQVFSIVEEQYKNELAYVDSLKGKLKDLGLKGVYLGIKGVYGSPQVRSEPSDANFKNNITQNGSEYFALEEELNYEVEQLTLLKLKYEQSKVDLKSNMSNIFVVNYASVSEGKAYPIRWVIVLFACISVFIFSIFVIIVFEKYRQYKSSISEY